MAFRGTYLINPEGVLEHITVNNYGIGRNIDETKRILQATQFVAEHGEVRSTLYPVLPPPAKVVKSSAPAIPCKSSRLQDHRTAVPVTEDSAGAVIRDP